VNNNNDQDVFRNPDRPSASLYELIKKDDEAENNETRRRVVKRISSPERFELTQLAKVNVLPKTELPYYDEETGLLPKPDEEDNEDIEIELKEDDAPFLKGYGRSKAADLSPVRIMKNPDGSLAQAALMQGALSKERREQVQQQKEAELNRLYSRDNTDWNDPMPDLETDEKGKTIGPSTLDMPEWKRHVVGVVKASLGRKTDLSILEQRRNLPIFKLREDLIKAVRENTILIVIGETGKFFS
jgi:ATP-dependent RNA helicase DHX8/PRP22